MDKKYTVKEFVEKYDEASNQQSLLNKCVVNKYVPFAEKIGKVDALIESTLYNKETKTINANSAARYVLYQMMLVDCYTDIRINFDKVIDEYDMLNSRRITDAIIGSLIPPEEIKEFSFLVDVKVNDINTNVYDIHNYVDNKFETLKLFFQPLIDKISERLDGMSDKDIEKLIDKISKMVTK